MTDEDEIFTPEMRARANRRIALMRRKWAADDARREAASREFVEGFLQGLKGPEVDLDEYNAEWLRKNSQ